MASVVDKCIKYTHAETYRHVHTHKHTWIRTCIYIYAYRYMHTGMHAPTDISPNPKHALAYILICVWPYTSSQWSGVLRLWELRSCATRSHNIWRVLSSGHGTAGVLPKKVSNHRHHHHHHHRHHHHHHHHTHHHHHHHHSPIPVTNGITYTHMEEVRS